MKQKIIKSVLTVLFAVLAIWYWFVIGPGTLRFFETTQYFPFRWSHLKDALSVPGGLSVYVSEFFVQFFLFKAVAAALVGILTSQVQILTWKTMKLFLHSDETAWYLLSFIPAFAVTGYLAVFGAMFSALTALLIVLLAFVASDGCRRKPFALTLALSVFLYWACGSLSFLFVFLYVLDTALFSDRGFVPGALKAAALVAVAALLPFLLHFFMSYTMKELYLGINLFNQPGVYPVKLFIPAYSIALLAVVSVFLPSLGKGWLKWLLGVILCLSVFAGGSFYVMKCFEPRYERVFQYDAAVMDGRWEDILEMAATVPPSSLAEMAAVNLSLAERDELLDRMFQYRQPGYTSLFPDYASGYVVTLTAAEAVFRSGMLNPARHYSYEEYESYTNYRLSSRHMKRIAEIDLISGNHILARRYLKDLSTTLFYGKWARKYLKDPESVSEDPEYARLMRFCDHSMRVYNDSSDSDKRTILRHLVEADGRYSIAFEYLLAYDLLTKDLTSLVSDLHLACFDGDAPEHIQEAVLLLGDDIPEDLNAIVSDKIRTRHDDFLMSIVENRPGAYLKTRFGNTYWYYYALVSSYDVESDSNAHMGVTMH